MGWLGDAPDNKGLNRAAEASAALGQEAFEWFKTEYANTADERAATAKTAEDVSRAQIDIMKTSTDLAKEYADYNRDVFRPLERRIVEGAENYDTPERREAAATGAVADVNRQTAAQRQAAMASMASYGGSVDGAKMASILDSGSINAAKAAAGAAKGARDRVEDVGYARMADAANMGRGLPSANATALATGTNAGNSAVNSSGAGLQATYSGAGLMNTGFQTGMQGFGQAGSLYGQAGQLENQARGQDLNFLSSVYGSFMKPSDPKLKKERKVETPTASMAALRETPIESWKYDPSKGGPEDGGQTHVGTMADRANETMGEEVAPGGEMLNIASMVGVVANSVKDIDRRLARLEQRKAA
jgi:hypothetical protein